MVIQPLWYLCLLVRTILIFVIRYLHQIKLKKVGALILSIMGLGFIYQYFFSSNKEIQFSKVFWHETRILHGILYLCSVYYVWSDNIDMASLCLALDIVFSLMYRFYFKK